MTGGAAEFDAVRRLERFWSHAWPAETMQDRAGWFYRMDRGVSHRANSVLAAACEGDMPLSARIDAVEAAYRDRGLAPCFQLSPTTQPEGLEAALADRGYTIADASKVQVAPVAALLSLPCPHAVTLADTPDDLWLDTGYPGPDRPIRAGIVGRIALARRFATLSIDGTPAAIGAIAWDSDVAGIFSMKTAPEFRRRSAATAILAALARLVAEAGVATMTLQVETDNDGARRLYAGLGFTTLYRYWYRSLPA
jgi:ribosomal protein S18 acetylase RimI-like enzyme